MKTNPHIIVSGGGTGGHIFPAISIANALKEKCPEAKILFVGAEGRREMEVILLTLKSAVIADIRPQRISISALNAVSAS